MWGPLATIAKFIYRPLVVHFRTAGITLQRKTTALLWGATPFLQRKALTGPKPKKLRFRLGITALRV